MSARKKRLPWRNHEDAVVESFRKDPKFAVEYLNAIFAEGDQPELLLALRLLAGAFGGMSALAGSAELNTTSLYRALSAEGNPELRSVTALLKAMGMRLAVQPVERRARG